MSDTLRTKSKWHWAKIALLPLILLLSVACLWVLRTNPFFAYENLAANHDWLLARVADNPTGTGLAFIVIYALFVIVSLPGAAFRTMAAGFLFGPVLGTSYAVFGATIGAAILFVIARASFSEVFRSGPGAPSGRIGQLADDFKKNALNYLLFLRLVPLFPFWIVNLAAAYVGMPLRVFAVATFFGIIPGTAVFSTMGSGLGDFLDQGQMPEFDIVFSPPILIPLLGLAILALSPIFVRRMRGNKKPGTETQSD